MYACSSKCKTSGRGIIFIKLYERADSICAFESTRKSLGVWHQPSVLLRGLVGMFWVEARSWNNVYLVRLPGGGGVPFRHLC